MSYRARPPKPPIGEGARNEIIPSPRVGRTQTEVHGAVTAESAVPMEGNEP